MAAIYSNGGGIFLASILLKEMRYLVYIRYLCSRVAFQTSLHVVPVFGMSCIRSHLSGGEKSRTELLVAEPDLTSGTYFSGS
jgi:hypothetical protein